MNRYPAPRPRPYLLATMALLSLLALAPAAHAAAEALAEPTVVDVQKGLTAQALTTPPAGGVPELGLEEVARLVVQAVAGKSWSLLASLLVVGLVLVARKVGAHVLPWLGTARGAVLLSALGGTATLLAVALGGGQPFTLGLLVSCLLAAAGGSGLFSWGQTLVKPRAVCLPEEAAQGTCKP